MRSAIWMFVALVFAMPAVAPADDAVDPNQTDETWLMLTKGAADTPAMSETDAGADAAPPAKGPPLPVHTIEGVGGCSIVPMAYVCNAGHCDTTCSKPSVAYTHMNISNKKFHGVSVTQVFFQQVEFGYAYNYLSVGSFYNQVKKAMPGASMGHDNVQLHHFNLRWMFLKENSFDCEFIPAVTAGVHFKYNSRIDRIDKNLGRGLSGLGYDKPFGIDWTLTATKTIIEPIFNRPLIITAGLRLSRAAQMGLFGFGDDYRASFEGSIVYWAFDQVLFAYEFRQKHDPYHGIPNVLYQEDSWQAFCVAWLVNDRLTIAGVIGFVGDVGNTEDAIALGVQGKYEF